jgi:hypothetical protein
MGFNGCREVQGGSGRFNGFREVQGGSRVHEVHEVHEVHDAELGKAAPGRA